MCAVQEIATHMCICRHMWPLKSMIFSPSPFQAAAVFKKHRFLWSKKERDTRSANYPQAAVPGHKLEILRLGNFFRSHFLLAEATINKKCFKTPEELLEKI